MRMTYKPLTMLYVDKATEELRVTFYVPDTSAESGERIYISMSYKIPRHYFQTERQAAYWVLQAVGETEHHETREWLKLDGVAIFDPHKEAPA